MGGQFPGHLGQQQRPLYHPIRQVVAHIGEAQPGHAGGDALLGVPSPLRCQPLSERLGAGVGHASSVRPDPSTLGVVGERGSRHEGRMRPDLGGKVMLVPTFR
jgi:hypothetical protein